MALIYLIYAKLLLFELCSQRKGEKVQIDIGGNSFQYSNNIRNSQIMAKGETNAMWRTPFLYINLWHYVRLMLTGWAMNMCKCDANNSNGVKLSKLHVENGRIISYFIAI